MEQKERQKYRELITDCDWWSKYYVTREDMVKVCTQDIALFYIRKICIGIYNVAFSIVLMTISKCSSF